MLQHVAVSCSVLQCTYTRALVYTYTYVLVYVYTPSYTYMHTLIHNPAHSPPHSPTNPPTHPRPAQHIHTLSPASTSALASTNTRAVPLWSLQAAQCNGVSWPCTIEYTVNVGSIAWVFAFVCVCAHIRICTSRNTCIHVHIHTHTHIYVYVYTCVLQCVAV